MTLRKLGARQQAACVGVSRMQNAHCSAADISGRETTAEQEIFVTFVILLALLADMAFGKKLCKRTVNQPGNKSGWNRSLCPVSFSDFDRFLFKSACCLVEGAV